ncbi:toll-like receptor 3 [Strongylocentrotus purpuratus]|uniref:TIR domain-containing protein n=1 Tax=Strongylocentrotus purpuratus TaxID=7668 RepID=A0A7M7GHK6_STRPU|nr:toll-like receptor 3 [Strongylocentrotus purpuratus]
MAFEHRVLLPLIIFFCIQTLHGDAVPITPWDLKRRPCHENSERKEANCDERSLDSVPQNLPENTEVLKLRSNKLTSLLNSTFKRYPLLTKLDIAHNDIRMIESRTFYPLKELQDIDMSFNLHLVLPDTGLFRWAKKLSVLELWSSNLISLPNDTLKWSPHLESVQLNYNRLTFINISSCGRVKRVYLSTNNLTHITQKAFYFSCHSETLDLTDNLILSVDPNVIASLHVRSLRVGFVSLSFEVLRNIFIGVSRSNIEQLEITYCFTLSEFPRDFFDPLQGHSLSVLDLSGNVMPTLYPFVFSNLTRTRLLDISGNRIETIEPDFFENMQDIRVLKLQSNRINKINTNNCPWKIGLTDLDLSDNVLTTVSRFTFLGLQNLTFLDMHSNILLTTLEMASFMGLEQIETINLSLCNIVNVELVTLSLKSLFLKNNPTMFLMPVTSFESLQSLVYLNLRKTGLDSIRLWNFFTNISLFDGLFSLTTLDLSENSIGSIYDSADYLSPWVFKPLSALQNLSLEDCQISFLNPLAFEALKFLRVLNLRGNKIKQLSIDIFKNFGQMTNIDLHNNRLTYLDKNLFLNNSRLTTLLLSENKLTRLNQSTFKLIGPSLTSVDLSGNPIDCNCELSWLLAWISGPLVLMNKNKTICSSASLERLRDKPLFDFDSKTVCSPNIALYSLTSLAIMSFVVIVVLVFHYRWQLRYKLFLLKLAAVGYNEMRDARDPNDYEFDMNVIFYDDDEEWAREHLLPTLEERIPQFQRNVFGDEDLVPGMHYLDAIDYVVSRSYKTVILLSRAAVRDRWFMLKFRTAMDHVSDTQTEFVVAVFIEDIQDDEIPFLARLYLSDGRPYLHWTEDVRGQEYFFNQLTKYLTINLRTNDLIPNE